MYIKKLQLENVGPIRELDYEFPFDGGGNPLPVILVGTNGSGKSIVLSHIVNTLLNAQQRAFSNSEVEGGKVYKYRSPSYIHTGTVRGVEVETPEVVEINKDEKRNVCNWLVTHGTEEDFRGFASVFDLIQEEVS